MDTWRKDIILEYYVRLENLNSAYTIGVDDGELSQEVDNVKDCA